MPKQNTDNYPRNSHKLRFHPELWLGLTVSAFFLYLAFRGLNFQEFILTLRRINLGIWLAGMALYITSYFFRGMRWSLMLKGVKTLSSWRMTQFVLIGFMCNNLLPARLGEFARALVIANKEGISARASFASVVLERVFDGVTIVLLLFLLILMQPFPLWVEKMGIFAAVLFLFCMIMLVLLGHKGESWIKAICEKYPGGIFSKITGFMLKFIYGLQMLRSKSAILWALILSLVIWSIEALNYLVIMRSLGLALPLGVAVFTLTVANLGIMIPSSPGNVGTMQYFCILALSLFALPKDQSLVFSIALHTEMFIPVTILGIFFLSRMGLSLKNIRLSRNRISVNDEC